MRTASIALAAAISLMTTTAWAQSPPLVTDDPNTAAEKALALVFAEAVFTFEIPTSTTLKGAIDWSGGENAHH
jgi:hypothetical protein